MNRHSILDEIPGVVQDKVRRALRSIPTLSDERHGTGTHGDEGLDATMAPAEGHLDEFRRICARKGIDADAVIALLSQDD
jgi:hypothetical protein